MSVNLLGQLENEFSTGAISKVASFLNESPEKTMGALKYAVPAVVGGLAQRSQTPQGAIDLLGLLQHGGFDGRTSASSLLNPTGLQGLVKSGGSFVSSLFGTRQSSLTDAISSTSGVSKASATSLLALAGSYVANLVSREATMSGGLNAGSLVSLLGAQGPHLASKAPAGLAHLLGVPGWSEPTRVVEPARVYATPAPEQPAKAYERAEERGGLGWLKWALPLLLLPLALWAWTAARGPAPAPRDVVGTTGSLPTMTRRTVCGQELDFAEAGVEAKLIGFVDDKARPIDDNTWFTFDRLEFETASPTPGPGSRAQIQNISEIMKCYPTLNLKVGGYTDNVGDPAANLRLSQQRAANTMQAIVANGVSASRLSAEGYGEQFPVASNTSDEGRQRNRRIDLRVTQR